MTPNAPAPAERPERVWDCIRCGLIWDDEDAPDRCPNCGDRPDIVTARYGIARRNVK